MIAYKLAKDRGLNIDWLEKKDQFRFKYEKITHLLPLIYLDYETCVSTEYEELVTSLLNFDINKAQRLLNSITNKSAEIMFQEAMLDKVQGKYQEAQEKFKNIESTYPDYKNSLDLEDLT